MDERCRCSRDAAPAPIERSIRGQCVLPAAAGIVAAGGATRDVEVCATVVGTTAASIALMLRWLAIVVAAAGVAWFASTMLRRKVRNADVDAQPRS